MSETIESILLLRLILVVFLCLGFDVLDCLHIGLFFNIFHLVLFVRLQSCAGTHLIILVISVSVARSTAIDPIVERIDFCIFLRLYEFD